jgi:SNF2 family DNA or RNA helicase
MTTAFKPVWEFHMISKNRFGIKFPYDPATVDAVRAISGKKWDATKKMWSFPLDLPTINEVTDLGKAAGCAFDIDSDLKAWVLVERKRISNLVAPDDISQVGDHLLPNLKADMPALWDSLNSRPFQLLGAEFIAQQRNVLMADQPGMGKTIQTLAAIAENHVEGPILVIAPRTAVNVTWPAEIKRWLGPDEVIYIINGALTPDERGALLTEVISLRKRKERIWVLCGPNYLRAKADLTSDGLRYARDAKGEKVIRVVNEGRPELFAIEWSAIVVDESHQTLAGATGNLKKQSAQRLGLGLLRVKDNGMRIALSGTPFRGKGHYMWGQIDWINPDRRPPYWQWIERHFGTTKNAYGMVINDRIKDEQKFYQELRPMMVRRTKTEVVKDLPEKTYGGELLDANEPESPIAVWLPMTDAQERQYRKMETRALLEISNEPDMPVNGVLAEMTRLKQIADGRVHLAGNDIVDSTTDSNKIDWILDFVEERAEGGGKVIIASQFTKFVYAISKALQEKGYEHYILTGKQNDAERKAAQEGFQSEGGHGIFLLNTKAGGVSLTLDTADDVVICDSTYNPDDQEQVEDRAHRVSRMHNVTIWYLASRGTIDESIYRLTWERERATKGIIDGQRGVAFTKLVADQFRENAIQKGNKK